MSVLEILGQVLIVAGGLVFLTAALGIVRFPDVYTRISAVGTAAGLGIVLVVTGALLMQPGISNAVKVAVIIALQLATSSVGSMAVARSSYLIRTPMRAKAFHELADLDARVADGDGSPQTSEQPSERGEAH
ncbi:cation:proton antiporter [Demequina activiva]|uniref:Na+/H+ antiporter subunit G n=1 Tax=Demequina activiva TaxID=1582364 RepID=A0A919UGM3_9MICO|nr:monovalent cation/H(+) antiporter subunit G [Demequina activiva]GIG54987.1 Na+/H+ antiporter subunit G [Demequina activiva]